MCTTASLVRLRRIPSECRLSRARSVLAEVTRLGEIGASPAAVPVCSTQHTTHTQGQTKVAGSLGHSSHRDTMQEERSSSRKRTQQEEELQQPPPQREDGRVAAGSCKTMG
jgi:hypothetical protein